MDRSVNVVAALTAIAGMVSMMNTPLLAQAVRQTAARPTSSVTLHRIDPQLPSGQPPAEVAAMLETMKKMHVDVADMRVLAASMQPGRANVDQHVKRQLALIDAMDKLRHKTSVRGALANLGVEIKKAPTADGIATSFIVRGKERLRVMDAAPAIVEGDPDPASAGGPAVHRDEYDDLEIYAQSVRDEALAVLVAADDEAAGAEQEYANMSGGDEECPVASGPAAETRTDCLGEAFNALLGVIGARAQGQASMSMIQAAWAEFKAIIDARPAMGVAIAAADALVATVSAEVIISAVVFAAVAYFGYELYKCLKNMDPVLMEPVRL